LVQTFARPGHVLGGPPHDVANSADLQVGLLPAFFGIVRGRWTAKRAGDPAKREGEHRCARDGHEGERLDQQEFVCERECQGASDWFKHVHRMNSGMVQRNCQPERYESLKAAKKLFLMRQPFDVSLSYVVLKASPGATSDVFCRSSDG